MIKKSYSKAKKYRYNTKSFLKYKRFLKKYRNKKRRKAKYPELIEKTTGAWEII